MTLAEHFKQFCKDRIRSVAQGYMTLATEKVTLKEIGKAYNRWVIVSGKKKLDTINSLIPLCEETFGDSRGTYVYQHLRVFLDEEDLEEFEKEHSSSFIVPSDKMANHILNSENKIELVRGLIEDKRALSSEIDDLESQVKTLEEQLQQREKVFDAFAKKDIQRDKEIIKIINALKTLLTLS